jgi:hypothetical protein
VGRERLLRPWTWLGRKRVVAKAEEPA